MPTHVPELHWEDGLLLRPQHLQAFQRHCQGLISRLAALRTFGYGVRRLRIQEEPIGDWVVEVGACELVLPDGTLLVLGETARIPAVEFRHLQLDARTLDVWLGVPLLEERASNVWAGGRFQIERQVFHDENTGADSQEIGVRRLNCRLFIGQRPDSRHATLKIAELRKVVREGEEGSRYELSPDFVPASLSVDASPRLHGILRDVLHKVEEKNEELLGHLGGDRSLLTGESLERPETLLKLQATNAILPVLQQIAAHPEMHPFDSYLQLCRLVGDLAIFSPDWRPPKMVVYDHDDPLRAFRDFKRVALDLLERAVDTSVVRRSFELVRPEPRVLEVAIPQEFLAEGVQLFIGVETVRTTAEVADLFQVGRTRIMAPGEVDAAMRSRLEGIYCHADPHIHASLRDMEGMVFLRLHTRGDLWERAVAEGRLALQGEGDDGETAFHLYATGVRETEESP